MNRTAEIIEIIEISARGCASLHSPADAEGCHLCTLRVGIVECLAVGDQEGALEYALRLAL